MVYKSILKRIFGLVLAIAMEIVLFVPLLIVGFIVKLTSKGPVLFVQERYGKNSKPFKLYKFRTMVIDAPDKANSEFTDIENYVTPFGKFLRKTSIDELPQLINIIKGDMAFIGPRPLSNADRLVVDLRKLNGGDQVLPGISGLAQVNGRNNISDKEKAAYDGLYARSISFENDFKLFFQTIVSVFRRDNVYKTFELVQQDVQQDDLPEQTIHSKDTAVTEDSKSIAHPSDSIIHSHV
ncbi:sugar transferase [Fructobacillus evanidus]|uniref:Teichoic acid (WcaJ n=1 Tax=Fructobacillus evanidus TaxID=3064281 RepID=A0ABM9ML63_9LACO|nr:Sugar transferase involved in LPS biosynthesis (colanic [Fructobacillus sp. LMG 32999]CAK1223684.1 Sugar transferase involved in LPS biosynthesis (colanic [Fructobacillus sp. LMG 32999]CAK1223763.1 Sugar transferase involved in LPS biosynthesis (colanic [Fructobacillus sp. LMG 32999]CAK1230914.1 Sugar transferase involved in LPS biosynthesis (colanic [Fructobacillus sp. LMG 32999]CAK1250743.1 Sugar transferase involved in LPS biosynthesis (colanic [Fructobacillus sp. LMG 32999]